ncbi:MAG: cytochrome c oxidase subunit 3 family protein [Candidatus Eisenbacteria bacterium]|nr:cytochrome c oxidase subunit 3 family protein [Candidatus Eisenbacteria bacterium]
MSTAVHAETEEHRDAFGARMGMWLFLFTELILFGGMFLLYAVYRPRFSADFHYAATTLDPLVGGVNTLILLTSSLTMVLAVATLERGKRRPATSFLSSTILFGLAFLVIKGFEWSGKIHHGLFPGSEKLAGHTPGENIFYGLYYGMTGLHALHVIVGIGILAYMLWEIYRRPRRSVILQPPRGEGLQLRTAGGDNVWTQSAEDAAEEVRLTLVYESHEEITHQKANRLEISGLYWHLVDVIWIFLFPLFYLIS